MQFRPIVHYSLVIAAGLSVNLIVYSIFPGNWLIAVTTSLAAMATLLPSKDVVSTRNKHSLTSNELSKPGDLIEMSSGEKEIHSTLGNVFDTMARDAARDLYSSEFTSTEDHQGNQPENCVESQSENHPEDVRLEVDPDGKLHYIFEA